MLRSITQQIFETTDTTAPMKLIPCAVTQVAPLLITFLGETNVPAQKIAGLTYSLGPAVALYSSPGVPIVIPTLTLGA